MRPPDASFANGPTERKGPGHRAPGPPTSMCTREEAVSTLDRRFRLSGSSKTRSLHHDSRSQAFATDSMAASRVAS